MNIDQNVNRPKLKKIKRPINRTTPLGSNEKQMQNVSHPQSSVLQSSQPKIQNSMQPNPSVYQQQPHVQMPNSNELNEYLDGRANLPNIRENQQTEYQPSFVDNAEYFDDRQYSEAPSWLNVKVFIVAIITFLVIGIFAGKIIFAQATVVRNGLQGVVVNTEVPRGRARCGIAERSQGCVLYVMNPQRQEMSAKDFYDLAAQVTGRQRFMIETGNMRYANTKIKPGDIAQLNIPPL